MRLSYYPGCSLGSTAKEFDLSTRSACQGLGIELTELEDWSCCGATSAHSTNRMLSYALPSRNISLAQQTGLDLAIPCAACFSRVKKADYALSHDDNLRQEIENIVDFKYDGSVNVLPLVSVIDQLGEKAIAEKVRKPLKGLKVACYYGCLMVRPPEITGIENPEHPMLLDNIMKALGAEPLKWSYKTECCGASLSLTTKDVVQGMVARIIDSAKEIGAMAIVTCCPLCQPNLEMRQAKEANMPTFYFTELIGLALGQPNTKKWFNMHLINPNPLLQSLSLAD